MLWRLISLLGVSILAIAGTLYAISNPGRAALHGTGDSAAWIQAWWSVAAIVVALTAPGIELAVRDREEAAKRHRAAAMLLLVGIRRWHRSVWNVVADLDVWLQTKGGNGVLHTTLPEPKLETSLEHAPDLSTTDVQTLLDAMAFRDAAQAGIDAAMEYNGADDYTLAKSMVDEGQKLQGLLVPIIDRLEKASGFNWRLE